jgi:hypothetical protein
MTENTKDETEGTGAPSALSAGLGISLALLWRPVPETLPPDPDGEWFSPMVWLALSDGRVLTGQALHKNADAKYAEPVHDWFAVDPQDGGSKSLSCFGNGLSVIAWAPLAVPCHPNMVNGRNLIPNVKLTSCALDAPECAAHTSDGLGMNLIKFIGDGDGWLNSNALHLEHPLTDHTLCGETLDGDAGTAGNFEHISAKEVTCEFCIAIIKRCRSIRIKVPNM